MNELLPYLYYSLPWLFVAGLSLLAVLGVGIGLAWPRLLVYPYLLVFFWVNSTSYGNLAVFASRSIYSRGSGLLLFGVLLWYVLGAWCCARVAASFARLPTPACNLRPWLLGWTLLLGAHVGAAVLLGVAPAQALAPSGFSNIVWMAPLIGLLLLAFRTREHVRELTRFILLAGLARALFGLGRWAAFGGDPNNVYANMNAIPIRLTFFDINDSLLCTVAFAIAAVGLFGPAASAPSRAWRAISWLTLGASALCLLLSYRRSAWIGFMLALMVIVLRLPPRARTRFLLAGVPLAGSALALVAARRLSRTRGADGGVGSMVYDMQSHRFGPESERLLELKFALADFLTRPLTGIGSWGRYNGYGFISWQNNPDGGLFVHSGVLHIALKAGLPGTILLLGMIGAFMLFARRTLAALPPDLLALGVAGVAGAAFMIPDLLIGTPFPQVRTTQMLALCLGLPYLAAAVGARTSAAGAAKQAAPPHRQLAPA